jgi:hypothetical protein
MYVTKYTLQMSNTEQILTDSTGCTGRLAPKIVNRQYSYKIHTTNVPLLISPLEYLIVITNSKCSLVYLA